MSAQVDETASGVANAHRDAILQVLARNNCFVFIRPSAYESTKMVKAGLATKSMDIHDKSSDWGPMAGMVPVDQAFNKLNNGSTASENPESLAHGEHGAAYPVQLEWTELLNQYLLNDKISRQDSPYTVQPGNGNRLTLSRASVMSRVQAFDQFSSGGQMTSFSGRGPFDGVFRSVRNSVDFCIHQSKVYWVKWDNMRRNGTLIPLLVWGYLSNGKKLPVTGDYDLWMVVPHFSALKSLGEHGAQVVQDMTVNDKGENVSRGASTASVFTQRLSEEMNQACAQAIPGSQRVFNHGAEAQNYAFTQKIDRYVGMFTPGGTSRMIDTLNEMPEVLADLQRMGYIVIFNKRYTDSDAQLMGQSSIKAKREFAQARQQNNKDTKSGKNTTYTREELIVKGIQSAFAIGRREKLHANLDETLSELRQFQRGQTQTVQNGGRRFQKGEARAYFRKTVLQVATLVSTHGRSDDMFKDKEVLVVQQLGNDIRSALESAAAELQKLQPSDFPQGLAALANEARILLREFSEAATSSTVNGGETDTNKLAQFLSQKGQTIEQILMQLKSTPIRN